MEEISFFRFNIHLIPIEIDRWYNNLLIESLIVYISFPFFFFFKRIQLFLASRFVEFSIARRLISSYFRRIWRLTISHRYEFTGYFRTAPVIAQDYPGWKAMTARELRETFSPFRQFSRVVYWLAPESLTITCAFEYWPSCLIRHFPFFLFFFFSIPRSSCEIFTSSLRNEVLNTETSNQSYSHIRCFSIKIFLLFFPEKASIEKETRIEKIIKMLRFFLLLF